MIRLDDEPLKRLQDWLEEDEDDEKTADEDADREDDDRGGAEQDGADRDDSGDDEETTSEFVQRIVREYSRLGHRTDRSEREE